MNNNIQLKKELSKLFNEVDKASKPDHCLLCNKKTDSFCNSHIVPQFILKRIAEKGMVYYGQTLFDSKDDFIETKKGINNAFTFKLICRDCDQRKFANYENPSSILNFESLNNDKKNNILIEMALKTHLSHINTKSRTYMFNTFAHPIESQIIKDIGQPTAYEIDVIEHLQYIKNLTKARKSTSFTFELIYTTLLDYEVGIATQTIIAYQYDLKGTQIFCPRDFSTNNLTKYFYLMILPFNGKTRIFFYVERKYKYLVKTIIDDFNLLTEKEKLHFLFISLIIHDEQFYINPSLQAIIKKDKKLTKLYTETDNVDFDNISFKEIINFKKYKNYLDIKYS